MNVSPKVAFHTLHTVEVLSVFLRLATSLELLDCCDPRPTAVKKEPTMPLLVMVSVVLVIVSACIPSMCERMRDMVVALLTSISSVGLVGGDDIFI